jgi:hypothetical protein
MKLLILLLIAAFSLVGQTQTRKVTLAWEDLVNPTGTKYNIYRVAGTCSSNVACIPSENNQCPYVSVATGLAGKTYLDQPPAIGIYCYHATSVYNNLESDPSTTAEAKVKPMPPGKLTISVTLQLTLDTEQ